MVLEARDVPLGGLRAMSVKRSLPQRALPTIGAWCFVDRFGPQVTTMSVDPHPHTGLQTVTWPLAGDIRHRDTLGSDVVLRPGALNLMTSGRGIAHSEHSVVPSSTLDAIQFWIALPESARDGDRGFESHSELPHLTLPAARGSDAGAIVVIGTFAGVRSPATTYSPLVGAQVTVPAGSTVSIPLTPQWEHGVLAIDGDIAIADDLGEHLGAPAGSEILYVGSDRPALTLSSTNGARVFLLGGEPLEESLVMWWNFVGRSHEEIADARAAWEAHDARFGEVPGNGSARIPAPPLPQVRLTPRTRRL
jgi:redox-sensitive bicupin YhaK (pirin superfamily)